MEFTLIIRDINKGNIYDESIGTPGLDVLDDIRSRSQLYKTLPVKEIYYYNKCPSYNTSMGIDISEDVARESGLFKGKTEVDVLINFKASMYADLVIEETWYRPYNFFEKLFKKSYLKYINVSMVISKEAIIDDWKKDGFPLVWEK